MERPLRVAMTVEQCWQRVPGGSGTYIVALTRELAGRDDISLRGLAARHAGPPAPDWVPSCASRFSRLPRTALYESWNLLGVPRAERTLGIAPDIVHATTWAIPPTRRPCVVTVHDLAFRRNPEHFTARGVRFFERALERTVAEASLVIVPSQATAADCVDAGIDEARIHVVRHGVHVVRPDAASRARFIREHALPERYLLWTGTREPRKNLARLLRAFALIAGDEPDLHLVLVGPAGWLDTRAGVDIGAFADRVHVLGRLSWNDLQCAYADAVAFCFPSLWEGFGMPVLEAMAHGLPVVTSAGTSMAEVIGSSGVLVEALDEHSIAAGILAAVGSDRDSLAAASVERARLFDWRTAADLTVQTYRAALGV